MSTWSWRYEDADGTVLDPDTLPDGLGGQRFPSQADAESWVGESWEPLLEAGVDAVRLYDGDTEVYGPMSLHRAE